MKIDPGLAHDVFRRGRHPLDPFFRPRSVAVIGATETPRSVGRTLLHNLISTPFGGTVYPVNPRRENVLGIKAYRSIADVPGPVDLAVVVTQAAQTSAPHLKARQHRFEIALPTEPLLMEADPGRLVQIVVNLLNNAAKYTEPGGCIWLSAERDAGSAVIRVRDTGMGVPPDMLPHIFELFTQGNLSADDAQGGIGAGDRA